MEVHIWVSDCLYLNVSFFINVFPVQMGANVKEFLHLVEEFVDMVGLQMSGFQDIYEVTENIGETPLLSNSTFSTRLLPSVR